MGSSSGLRGHRPGSPLLRSALIRYAEEAGQMPHAELTGVGLVLTLWRPVMPSRTTGAYKSDGITRLLNAWQDGDAAARDQLFVVVYDELRRRASAQLRRERQGHTLRPTALVHEAYLRLLGQDRVKWQNRAQFFALAAKMMRRILVNHAEAHRAAKRGGGAQKLSLDDAISFFDEQHLDLLELNEALERLSLLDERQGRIIELRFFGGLTVDEAAGVLEISPATVKREWDMAKTWLLRELTNAERAG